MVHFCAKLIRAEDSSAVTQPCRDRTHYLHGAWLRTQGNALVHIRLAGSVLRIVTDHLLDLQCFEFWSGGLQKSSQYLLCYLELTMVNVNIRHPSATYTRISQPRLIPEQIPNHRRIRGLQDTLLSIRLLYYSLAPSRVIPEPLQLFPRQHRIPPVCSPPSLTIGLGSPSVTKHTAPFADAFGQHNSEHYSQVIGLYWLRRVR